MDNCEWCNKQISSNPFIGADGGKYCSEYCLAEADDDLPVRRTKVRRVRKSEFFQEKNDASR